MFEFYKNKKVLVTGHTGFKGAWLVLWLKYLGAEVLGYALPPETKPNLFSILNLENQCQSIFGNILDKKKIEAEFQKFSPEIVFHLAAQPLVRRSYEEPVLTYETNVIGTLNVLEAARKAESVAAFVNVTTDKCYENKETLKGYVEEDSLGGYDMYSSSKACSEILTASYRRSFLAENGFFLATARAGNVIGGGDWAEDRLIPDCIRAINLNEYIEIRHPNAVRPWQHVFEPLFGYLILGAQLSLTGERVSEAFNFGPAESGILTVKDVVEKTINYYGKGEMKVYKTDDLHEAGLLLLNVNKAQRLLAWQPKYTVDVAIRKTVDWYKSFYKGDINMQKFSIQQIEDYQNICL